VNSSMISALFGGRGLRFTGTRAGNVEIMSPVLRWSAHGALPLNFVTEYKGEAISQRICEVALTG
jgi:hypothetical protein